MPISVEILWNLIGSPAKILDIVYCINMQENVITVGKCHKVSFLVGKLNYDFQIKYFTTCSGVLNLLRPVFMYIYVSWNFPLQVFPE